MQQKVLVTGADGMLGSHVVRVLLSRQYTVKAMIQPGRNSSSLDTLDIEKVEADIRDMEQVWEAIKGCQYIVHTAASTSVWPARNPEVFAVNLEGTMNVVWAASALGIKRLIHVSSAAVFGSHVPEKAATESDAYTGYKYGLDYIDSKYEAHQMVKKATRAGLDAVIVNPTFMFGAYDSGQGSSSLILAVKNGKLLAVPPGGKNFVCASDVADAIVNAIDMGRSGESYILGNENLPYLDLMRLITQTIGGKTPKLHVPASLMNMIGQANKWIARQMNSRPLISPEIAKMSCDKQFFSSQKAVAELKLRQTPLDQGIREAWEWYEKNGLI